MLMDHYLIVKEWQPNFDPTKDKMKKVVVYVRFPYLPVEYYYDQSLLFSQWKKIGQLMRISSLTSLTSRGKFSGCVSKLIQWNLSLQSLTWEGIQIFCFKYGFYGHGCEWSPQNILVEVAEPLEKSTDEEEM